MVKTKDNHQLEEVCAMIRDRDRFEEIFRVGLYKNCDSGHVKSWFHGLTNWHWKWGRPRPRSQCCLVMMAKHFYVALRTHAHFASLDWKADESNVWFAKVIPFSSHGILWGHMERLVGRKERRCVFENSTSDRFGAINRKLLLSGNDLHD